MNPHIILDTLSTAEFWTLVDQLSIRLRNQTMDRHVFLITKQLRDKTVQHFYVEKTKPPKFQQKLRTLSIL